MREAPTVHTDTHTHSHTLSLSLLQYSSSSFHSAILDVARPNQTSNPLDYPRIIIKPAVIYSSSISEEGRGRLIHALFIPMRVALRLPMQVLYSDHYRKTHVNRTLSIFYEFGWIWRYPALIHLYKIKTTQKRSRHQRHQHEDV